MASLADLQSQIDRPQEQGFLAKLGQTWPARLAKEAYSAMTLPGDVYQGNVSMYGADGMTNPSVIERSTNLAGMVMGGTYAGAPVGAVGAGPARLQSAVVDSMRGAPAAATEADIMAARQAGMAAAMAKRQKVLDREIAAGKIAPGSELTFAEQQADLVRLSRYKAKTALDAETLTPSQNTGARLDSEVMRQLKGGQDF